MMTCPKCGLDQEQATECIRCGIVIERFRDAAAIARPGSWTDESRKRGARSSLPWTPLLRMMLLISTGVLAISYLLKDELPDGDDILPELLLDPIQTEVDMTPFEIEAGEIVYTINPLYAYELYGMVVSFHNCGTWWDIYHRDKWKDFINVKDLCLIWGVNVQTEVYKDMRFTSDSWTCTYYWPNHEVGSIFDHTCLSNNHLLCRDESLSHSILKTAKGDQIHLKGYLAEYSHSNMDFHRGTSINRTDTGNGACETVYVEEFEIIKTANRFWRATYSVCKYVILLTVLLLLVRFLRSPKIGGRV